MASSSITISPQKSKTNSMRPKGLRLDSSTRDVDDEADIKSDDDSSWDLIPSSTPQRKRVSSLSPKKRGHVDDQDFVTTPQKKFKVSSKGGNDNEAPFQLPTPVSTAKKSSLVSATILSTRDDVLEVHDSASGDEEQTLPCVKRSKLRSSIQAVPTTPLKRGDGLPYPPTPSSIQRNRPQREYLGTLDCDWDSDYEVRVSCTTTQWAPVRLRRHDMITYSPAIAGSIVLFLFLFLFFRSLLIFCIILEL